MTKDFLTPTKIKVLIFLGAFLLAGLAIEDPQSCTSILGDLPLIRSLLARELIFYAEGGLPTLIGHLLLTYLMGCSLGFLFHDTAPLKAKLAIAALGSVLAATLVFALSSAFFSKLESWNRASLERPSTTVRILSRGPAKTGKLSLRTIRVDSPEYTERVKASLRKAGLNASDFGDSDYDLRVEIGITNIEDVSPGSFSGDEEHCGLFHNVRYLLTRQGDQMVELESNGWATEGHCRPNVFDDMSRVLAGEFMGFASGTGRKLD